MKSFLFGCLLLGSMACSKPADETAKMKANFSDDYVLVEFASKLEEDYHRLEMKNPPPEIPETPQN
jgi:hypothetical protein